MYVHLVQTFLTSCVLFAVDCPAGYEHNPSVGPYCVACAQGYYRNVSESLRCAMCPSALTTRVTNATSAGYCNLGKLRPINAVLLIIIFLPFKSFMLVTALF